MEYFRKAFLFGVGLIVVSYEEVEKTIKKTLDTIEEEREKMRKQIKAQQAH